MCELITYFMKYAALQYQKWIWGIYGKAQYERGTWGWMNSFSGNELGAWLVPSRTKNTRLLFLSSCSSRLRKSYQWAEEWGSPWCVGRKESFRTGKPQIIWELLGAQMGLFSFSDPWLNQPLVICVLPLSSSWISVMLLFTVSSYAAEYDHYFLHRLSWFHSFLSLSAPHSG